MKGASLKATVMRKHRGLTLKEAFLKEYQEETDADRKVELAKSAPQGSVATVDFEIRAEGSVGALSKGDSDEDDMVIWGPASVEVVDKEDDRIQASALEEALPQLLKRSRLSYEHSDQIVGKILDGFETEEPVTVKIGEHEYTRDDFPTDVLKLDDMEPALYVAGEVYGDTNKAQEVRDGIEKGDIRSYSISGEAIQSSMAIEDGKPITDISKLDLSAVTLCNEGMNQKSKFGVVQKMDGTVDAETAASLLKNKTMGEDDNDPLTKSGMESILDKHLPDGELATKADVEGIVDKRLAEKNATNTGSPTDGTPERPDGANDSSPVEEDQEYDGDNDTWGDAPADDSDKVEEKSGGLDLETIKAALPDDQYKAVEPALKEAMGPDGEGRGDGIAEPPESEESDDELLEVDPEPDAPEMGVGEEGGDPMEEDDDEIIERKAKSLGMNPTTLTQDQREALAGLKLSDIQKSGGASAPNSDVEKHADGTIETEDDLAKAEGNTLSGSNFFNGDGGVRL